MLLAKIIGQLQRKQALSRLVIDNEGFIAAASCRVMPGQGNIRRTVLNISLISRHLLFSIARICSRRCLASASEIWGYAPIARSFSIPPKRYLSRQSLPPVGLTRRNKPPPSKSFCAFGVALIVRILVSVNGTILLVIRPPELFLGVSRQRLSPDTPKNTPKTVGFHRTLRFLWTIKKPAFLLRKRVYVSYRITPDYLLVAMQGLEPRTLRI